MIYKLLAFKKIIGLTTILFFWDFVHFCNAAEKSARHLCQAQILRAEKHFKIPDGLLSAVALIESGKVVENKKTKVAWPWVLNVEGVPKFYKTKTEAALALKKYLDAGVMNIDVGCMQLNYRHHGKAFSGPSYMLDPRRNIDYGAQFLLGLHKRYKSWTKAVGFYHSATLKHQVPYRKKVYHQWQAVRHQVPESSGESIQQGVFLGASPQARRLMVSKPGNTKPEREVLTIHPYIVGHITPPK